MLRKYWLLAALILGILVRVYNVASVPLYGDELTMVYDSYSILKTGGYDSTGSFLPVTFKMGAGRPGGYIYFSLPFVAVFGPSAWGVRMLSLLSGSGLIVLIYFLGKKLFNTKVGLISATLLAVNPWDIYLSRLGFESHFALFLSVLGIVALLNSENKKWLYVVWAFSWGVALHTYPTFKLTLPLIFVAIIWYTKKTPFLYRGISLNQIISAKKVELLSLIILGIFASLAVRETFYGGSEDRFSKINIFSDSARQEEVIQKINSDRTISTLPNYLKPFFYNRAIEYSTLLLDTYVKSIGHDFLFLKGDRNPRHNPGEMGMLYLIELPLIILAFYFSKKQKKTIIFVLSWILIVPLATMLLGDTHALRNSFMLVPILLLSAWGISNLKKKYLYIVLVAIFVQGVFVIQRLYFVAPNKFASFLSKTAKEASSIAETKKLEFDYVFLSNQIDNIEFAYPVYAKIDPWEVISQCSSYPKKFENVVIVSEQEIEKFNFNSALFLIEEKVGALNPVPKITLREITKK